MSPQEDTQKQKTNGPVPVTSLGLRLSYWYVTHKLQIKAAVVAVLVVLNIGLFGYSAYRATILFYVELPDYQQSLRDLTTQPIDYAYFRQANAPRPLQIATFEAVGGQDSRYDLVVKLSNPNADMYARSVTVEFIAGGEVVDRQTGFVLPGDERYFLSLAKRVNYIGDAQIRVASVEWQRVHFYEAYAEPRLRFVITDAAFTPASELRVPGELPISSLRFTVRNDTGYGFWNIGFATALLSGSGIGGINYISLDQFLPGEERNVEVRWQESLPGINDMEILPDVDILNEQVYMPSR